jgi:hypothetical protein
MSQASESVWGVVAVSSATSPEAEAIPKAPMTSSRCRLRMMWASFVKFN